MSRRIRLLVVDDSPDTLDILDQHLVSRGYDVVAVSGARLAMDRLATETFDVVLTDLRMPEIDGLELVRFVRGRCPDTEVMMITGYGTIESAVEAVKLGAEEYLQKPFTDEELFAAVARVVAKLESQRQARREAGGQFGLIGESLGMRKAFAAIRHATTHRNPVLILGEPGSGCRSAARAIARSDRPVRQIVIEQDAASEHASPGIWRELLEDERTLLFVSGIEAAGPDTQRALLEIVERRPGGGRIVACSIPLLPLLPERGAFRADLYERLAAEPVVLPPLRERQGDLELLVDHFAVMLSDRLRTGRPRFGDRALHAMSEYSWPGNVEECRAAVFDAILRAGATDVVDLVHLPAAIRERGEGAVERPLSDVERDHLRRVLARTGGNRSRAAEILGIDRKTLRQKVRAYDLAGQDEASRPPEGHRPDEE